MVLACTVNWADEVQAVTIIHKKQNILQFIFAVPYLRFAGHCTYLFQTRDVFKALANSSVFTSNTPLLALSCVLYFNHFPVPMSFLTRIFYLPRSF